MSEDLILGIDVGTTAVKVAVFTARGALLHAHATGYGIARLRPEWAEQDPLAWWQGCLRGIQAVLLAVPAGAVRAIGIVSQVNTHVFTDDGLRPLAPAITWQDQRCAEIARQLDGRFTAEEKTRIWGGPFTLDASRLVSRAAWFARYEPERWARTRWVLSPKDFVVAKLTGQVASDGLSSIGLVDRSGTRYLGEAVALVDGLARRLPPLADAAAPVGRVTDVDLGAAGMGLDAAAVVVGTMDAFGNIYGSATTEPGRAMISCGTSVIVAGASAENHPSRAVVTFPPVTAPSLRGLFIHAGPTQAGGDALRWWSRTRGVTLQEALANAATASPGSSGVVFTPHLMGERAPLWDSAVRGSFLGLSATTTDGDLARAVLEGVAMSARQVLAEVESACGGPLASVTFSGGGSRSDLWTQIYADVLGRPVERLAARDNSAVLGAALLGSVGAGIHPDIGTAARAALTIERVFIPDAASAELLAPLYGAYVASYQALREVHDRLGEWRERYV
jgi:xylulokinase